MKYKKTPINIYSLLLLSIFFDAYALFYIQSYPVTIFTIVSIVFLIHNFLSEDHKIIKMTTQSILLLVFILYLIFNYIFFGLKNTTSFLQILYFFILSLFAYRNEEKTTFDGYCKLFQKIMTYISIYGIYQFVGRIFKWPFTDLIVQNHMVTGYNWTNTIKIFGQTLYRSNAIFREPSYFAQMLEISLLIYISSILYIKEKKRNNIFSAVLQVIALITTFSGTGILMLVIGFGLFASVKLTSKSFWNKIFPVFLAFVCIGSYVLFYTTLGNYFSNRVNELFVYNRDASSGFVRFRAWILVVEEAWEYNLFLGSGVGTGASYVSKYAMQYFGMTLNGFARVATELGLIGITVWCIFIMSFLRKKTNLYLSNEYLAVVCSLIPLIFMQEAFSSNIFWMLIILINCKLSNVSKGAE